MKKKNKQTSICVKEGDLVLFPFPKTVKVAVESRLPDTVLLALLSKMVTFWDSYVIIA